MDAAKLVQQLDDLLAQVHSPHDRQDLADALGRMALRGGGKAEAGKVDALLQACLRNSREHPRPLAQVIRMR
jgi:hypothetical protein